MDFLRELEFFIQEQKKKLIADKEFIRKATNPEEPKRSPKMVNKACSPITEYPSKFPDPKVNFPPGTHQSMHAGLKVSGGPLDHPKYGLPGLGEYEERRKFIDKAQKLELNRIYSEQSKPHSAPLDYDEVLAKKREEEMHYRHLNSLGGMGLRGAQSDGFLNRNINEGPAFQRLRPSSLNSSGPVGLQEMGDLSGIKYTESEDQLPLVSQPDPPYVRNSLFSNPDPFLSQPQPRRLSIPRDPSIFDEPVRQLPPNPRVGIIPNGESSEDIKRRQKAAYRQELEMQIQEQKFRKKRQDGSVGQNISPPIGWGEKVDQQIAFPGFGSDERSKERKAIYQLELERQVEEQKLRRLREKDEFERLERKLLHENQIYDPWGKGGGGAPNRDKKGNVITRRLAASDREGRLVQAIEESPIGEDGRRKIPETWHENHWPLPVDKGAENGRSTYQEDLQRQIQEKKRREQQEKEAQRIEEEKMMQRLEEQRQKMQAEYDTEVRKQRQREEDQRRKADVIVKLQEEQRQEAELRKKQEREQRWKQPEKEKEPENPRSSSPPVPALHQANHEFRQVSPHYNNLNAPSVVEITYTPDKRKNNTFQLEIPKNISPRSPMPSPRISDSRQKSSSSPFADSESFIDRALENTNPPSLVESLRSPSPPIPAVRHRMLDPNLPPQRWNSSYIPSIVELKAPAHPQRRGAYIAQMNKSHQTKDKEDKTHILGQLSAMRRQLQIEQQQLQQQIHRDDPYIVYDPRLENIRAESDLFKPRDKFISKKASQVPFLQKSSPNANPDKGSSFSLISDRKLDENKENTTSHLVTHLNPSTACTNNNAFQVQTQSSCTSVDSPIVPARLSSKTASRIPVKIKQDIDEDYLRVESLTSAIGQRNETARERRRQLALDPFDGLDPEEIASKNRHRLQELERLKNGDIVNRSNGDADSILNSFLNSNSYER